MKGLNVSLSLPNLVLLC